MNYKNRKNIVIKIYSSNQNVTPFNGVYAYSFLQY